VVFPIWRSAVDGHKARKSAKIAATEIATEIAKERAVERAAAIKERERTLRCSAGSSEPHGAVDALKSHGVSGARAGLLPDMRHEVWWP
jgi:hypothetical protein